MPPAGFEPTISAGERPQTSALDDAATGIGIQNSQCFNMVVGFHCCLPRQEDYKNKTFLIPKDFYQVLFQLTAHSWVSYSLGISYCAISSPAAWTHVQNYGSKFYPTYRYATRDLHLHCLIGANISDDCFPCLCATVILRDIQRTQNFEQSVSLLIVITLPLAMVRRSTFHPLLCDSRQM